MAMPEYFGEFRSPLFDRSTKIVGKPKQIRELKHRGDEGKKFTINASVLREKRKRNAGSFFIKQFSERIDAVEPSSTAEQHPVQQEQKWLRLRSLGAPVVKTFRLDFNKREILMTDVSENGQNKIYDRNKPWTANSRKIKNMDKVKEQVRITALEAYDKGNGVWLGPDAFAIVVDKENLGRVELLDLGVGSYLLKNEFVEGRLVKILENRVLQNVTEFIEEVLEGKSPYQEPYWVG
jgi:hypothetical protein